ncbi:hypothetical protein LNQ52_14940 [Klebsiella pneumoniae subsp. pneumoniae]|nr:hypothetical protein [Klebsiella pneumoniae subsp. pneumoniae]
MVFPIGGAKYTIAFESGAVLSGMLDDKGYALHTNVPPESATVEYEFPEPEPDKPWDPYSSLLASVDAELGDGWTGSIIMDTDTDLDRALAFYQPPPESWYSGIHKKIEATGQWIWETIQGDFNDNQSTGQVVTGTVISMIPLVDQICDVRDPVANCMKIKGRKR